MKTDLPDELDPARRRPRGWKRLVGSKILLLSIAAHILLGLGAGYYVVQRYTAKRKMTFSAGPPTTNPSKRAMEHKVALGKKSKAMSAPAQAKRITAKNAFAKVALPDMPAMPSTLEVIPNRMAGLGGVGVGFGSSGAGGSGGGGGGGINFFGLRAQARSVVFLLDISSSMVQGKKNNASYSTLETEVIKTIKGLPSTMRFGVIVFAGEAEAYRPVLIDARPDERERAIAWYKKQAPTVLNAGKVTDAIRDRHHGTRTDLALEKAFGLKADVIFLASDGEPSGALTVDEILAKVDEMQKPIGGRTTINSIAYMADGGQRFMQELASRNKGTFKEVR
jgi:hypothetical protein